MTIASLGPAGQPENRPLALNLAEVPPDGVQLLRVDGPPATPPGCLRLATTTTIPSCPGSCGRAEVRRTLQMTCHTIGIEANPEPTPPSVVVGSLVGLDRRCRGVMPEECNGGDSGEDGDDAPQRNLEYQGSEQEVIGE